MRVIIALLALLLACPAHAIILVGFGEGGGTCLTQSTDVSLTTNNASSTFTYSANDRGQSWKAGATGTLYSITLYRNDNTAYSSDLGIRIGNNKDLSATYTTAFTCHVRSDVGAVECVIPEADRPSLTAGSTYYMMMVVTQSYQGSWSIARDSAGGYADGTAYTDITKDYNGTAAVSDLYFVAKMCD